MSVSDGEKADANNFNSSFMSREVDTSTAGKVDLNDAGSAAIVDAQLVINTNKTDIATNASDIATNQTNIANNSTAISANSDDIADIRTTQGTADGDTDLGTFTGTIITDNVSVKTALQEIESALEPLTDALDFQGTWDATTNTPTLASGTGTKGHFYIVSVAGATNLDGITDWQNGDWAVFDGTVWRKVDNTDSVSSVFGRTGAVTAQANDYTWSQIDKTTSPIDDLSDVNAPSPTDTQVLTWDNGTSMWIAADASGGGSGQGGVNYITNPDAELDADGWNGYSDPAGVDPVDGQDGIPAITFTRVVTTDLRGDAVFQFSKDAADRQGQGHSFDFTIDGIDREKRLNISFEYLTDANYVDGDVGVFIYDITNTTIIFPEVIDIPDAENGGKFQSRFQTTTSISYRIIFHQRTTSALAYDLLIDSVLVGPDSLVPGGIVTEWQAFTPTGTWTSNATYTGFWRRVGDSMEINYHVVCTGAPSPGTSMIFNMPTGYLIDLNKVPGGDRLSAYGNATNAGVTEYDIAGFSSGASNIRVLQGSQSVGSGNVNSTTPFAWNTGDNLELTVTVPIEGWSAGALLSTTENLLSTARGRFKLSGNQNITSTTETKVEFDTVEFDNLDAFSTSNNEYTIPRDGFYYVKGSAVVTNFTGEDQMSLGVAINGTVETSMFEREAGAATNAGVQVSTFLQLSKGDLVTITADSSTDANYDVASNAAITYFEIFEVPDFSTFSVFGETELVDAGSSTFTNFTNTTFTDMTSIVLPAGEWDLSAQVVYKNNGVGVLTNSFIAISENSGTTTTDHVPGRNTTSILCTADNGGEYSLTIPRHNVVNSTSKTYYLKGFSNNGTNKQVIYYLSARKIK